MLLRGNGNIVCEREATLNEQRLLRKGVNRTQQRLKDDPKTHIGNHITLVF